MDAPRESGEGANSTMANPSLTYRNAGVDVDRANEFVGRVGQLASSTRRPGAIDAFGGFGALFDPRAAGYSDPVLVSSTDGVGTKLMLAVEMGLNGTIGIDLVAMCVNDLVVQGAEPLFFLDYFAAGQLEPDIAEQVLSGVAEGCRQANCALVGGETAEMPGLYAKDHYDLAGFAVGAAERGQLLPRMADIEPGDALIGLASSGLHSNGFSLVRAVVSSNQLELAAPSPFDAAQSLGEALLTPTTIYTKPVLAAHATGRLKAAAHITGGGVGGNLPRVLPKDVGYMIDWDAIAPMPVFEWLTGAIGLDREEARRTFNMGVGMILVCAPDDVDNVLSVVVDAGGPGAYQLGEVTA